MAQNQDPETVNKPLVLKVLADVTNKLTDLLNTAKQQVQKSLQHFAESDVSGLGGSIGLYSAAFLRFGVASREAFDDILRQHYRHQEVRDAVEELDDIEADWNKFLKATESRLSGDELQSSLCVGSPGPCDVEVKDARTGRLTSVRGYLSEGHAILVLLRHFA